MNLEFHFKIPNLMVNMKKLKLKNNIKAAVFLMNVEKIKFLIHLKSVARP